MSVLRRRRGRIKISQKIPPSDILVYKNFCDRKPVGWIFDFHGDLAIHRYSRTRERCTENYSHTKGSRESLSNLRTKQNRPAIDTEGEKVSISYLMVDKSHRQCLKFYYLQCAFSSPKDNCRYLPFRMGRIRRQHQDACAFL